MILNLFFLLACLLVVSDCVRQSGYTMDIGVSFFFEFLSFYFVADETIN